MIGGRDIHAHSPLKSIILNPLVSINERCDINMNMSNSRPQRVCGFCEIILIDWLKD